MTRRAIVVGSGPVGCLSALSLSKAGWSVTVYEARSGAYSQFYAVTTLIIKQDMRLPENKTLLVQRSINLAISSRGIAAFHAIDPLIAKRFLKTVIPMRGRMIHLTNGAAESQLYDPNGQARSFT